MNQRAEQPDPRRTLASSCRIGYDAASGAAAAALGPAHSQPDLCGGQRCGDHQRRLMRGLGWTRPATGV